MDIFNIYQREKTGKFFADFCGQKESQVLRKSEFGIFVRVSKKIARRKSTMKKEYNNIVAHAKPKWVEEGRKEEREDNIRKTIPVILQL